MATDFRKRICFRRDDISWKDRRAVQSKRSKPKTNRGRQKLATTTQYISSLILDFNAGISLGVLTVALKLNCCSVPSRDSRLQSSHRFGHTDESVRCFSVTSTFFFLVPLLFFHSFHPRRTRSSFYELFAALTECQFSLFIIPTKWGNRCRSLRLQESCDFQVHHRFETYGRGEMPGFGKFSMPHDPLLHECCSM